jgi:hypothetical protein
MVESYYNIKNGCKKWQDCFTCPFDDCGISQNALRGTNELRQQRNNRLKEMFKQGYGTTEAAEIVGVTSRTSRRVKALTKST